MGQNVHPPDKILSEFLRTRDNELQAKIGVKTLSKHNVSFRKY